MKNKQIIFKYLLSFIGLFIFSSAKSQNDFKQQYISPNVTDKNISDWLSPHYIIHNKKIHKEPELIIFFPGTGEIPSDLSSFIDTIAQVTTHTIEINYPNTLTPWTYCQDKNEMCFELYRREVLWGVNDSVSSIQNISKENSVINRITKLLKYLNENYKDEGWSAFLNNGHIVWSKIILGGFSQGGGLSLFMSKFYDIKRVVLLSAPSDYFIRTHTPASWLSKKSETDCSKIYCFSSLTDNIVPFYIQYATWNANGLIENSIIINSINDLSDQHQLILANGDHGTTVVDKSNAQVWKYLFNTSPPDKTPETNHFQQVKISQTNSNIIIELENQYHQNKISILNTNGMEIYTKYSKETQIKINTLNFHSGLFILLIQNETVFFSRKIWIN